MTAVDMLQIYMDDIRAGGFLHVQDEALRQMEESHQRIQDRFNPLKTSLYWHADDSWLKVMSGICLVAWELPEIDS